MPIKTLDEYLKQYATAPKTTEQKTPEKTTYKVIEFYKETEFQETPIGKIPKEWRIVKLYEITEKVKAGGTPRVSRQEYWNGNIPFVKIEDLTASRKYLYSTKAFITELGLRNSNAWIVPEGSLLLAMYGSMGEVAINKIKVATNQAILGIVPRPNITLVEYLYYWFLYFKPRWRRYAKWTTQPNLTAEIVKSSYIPFPPLEEQWGIAEVLSTVDRAIEATERVIEKLERLKRGLMQELLTKGIGHKEYKQTPIGKIPKQWTLKKLGEIAKIRRGASPRPKGDPRYFGGNIPWIKISDLTKYQRGFYLTRTDDTVTEEGKKKSVYLEDGTLIISNSGTIGRPAIIKTGVGGCIHDGFIAVEPIKAVDKYYLFYFFDFKKEEFQLKAQIGTQGNMNTKIWRSIKLPLPPYEEQKRIVAILSTIDGWIELEKNRKEKLERLKRGLMELLLTGRVRVRVERVS